LLPRSTFTADADWAQGIAMAPSEQPDLILMDLKLPDIRGEEAYPANQS
jgi:CheY-like chemotaxis protein